MGFKSVTLGAAKTQKARIDGSSSILDGCGVISYERNEVFHTLEVRVCQLFCGNLSSVIEDRANGCGDEDSQTRRKENGGNEHQERKHEEPEMLSRLKV